MLLPPSYLFLFVLVSVLGSLAFLNLQEILDYLALYSTKEYESVHISGTYWLEVSLMGDLSGLFSWGTPDVSILRSYLLNCSDSPWGQSFSFLLEDFSLMPASREMSGRRKLKTQHEVCKYSWSSLVSVWWSCPQLCFVPLESLFDFSRELPLVVIWGGGHLSSCSEQGNWRSNYFIFIVVKYR